MGKQWMIFLIGGKLNDGDLQVQSMVATYLGIVSLTSKCFKVRRVVR